MPELPEVETIVRDLRPHLTDRRIESVRAGRRPLRRRWQKAWATQLQGSVILDVTRRGKWIVMPLDSGHSLVFHMGMTGQLRAIAAAEPHDSHTHLVFTLDDGTNELRFRDIRRFGSVTLFADPAALEEFFTQSRLGPEPFDIDPTYWRTRLAATQRCLKSALLDQQLVAGVGNIYADESLYEARLPPTQRGTDTPRGEADRLRRAVAVVLRRAIDQRGSSIRNYVGGSGLKGQYQEEFRVYGRTGKPCPRCRTGIERIRLAGRSTHFCPKCQKVESEETRAKSRKR
ncbi:MAG: bifunctional DNA-formamidopyrimidine glycosylase/DNA-(apurinic or apyrimidinic site) lyase [Gemmataceae bacterium]|nr:bifunctional DNA-formamidopyrimidine glycosylase/DNA-(apurinic or apyrimidinic site) lyase [Gemmataceae bacterium]